MLGQRSRNTVIRKGLSKCHSNLSLYSLAGFEVNEKVRIRVMQGCLVITAE
ncbi:type I addiction module toxin, SymE family [Pseudomonas aeruginosa]|nr:type I addiction module toxin, SymE family [Pseudomonas aeruginosa]